MEYDRFGNAIASEYGRFASQLQAIYASTRLAGSRSDPRAASTLAHQAFVRFFGSADSIASDYLKNTTGGVLTNPETLTRAGALLGMLRTMSIANIETMLRGLRGARDLEPVMTLSPGIFSKLIGMRRDSLVFETPDGAGRKWKSEQLARFLARDFAYQAQVDAWAQSLIDEGVELAQVSYADPSHDGHGQVVSLTGSVDTHPSLASVRASVFHPNATALLTHVHPE